MLEKPEDLAHAERVCRRWREMGADDSLWEKFCEPYPMLTVIQGALVHRKTWKQLYGQQALSEARARPEPPAAPRISEYFIGVEVREKKSGRVLLSELETLGQWCLCGTNTKAEEQKLLARRGQPPVHDAVQDYLDESSPVGGQFDALWDLDMRQLFTVSAFLLRKKEAARARQLQGPRSRHQR